MALEQWQQDFIEQLNKVPKEPKWYLSRSELIRRGNTDSELYECPATAVVNYQYKSKLSVGNLTATMGCLNLNREQMRIIANAADNYDENINAELRSAMLEAVGLLQ